MGKLTCENCHDSLLQIGSRQPADPVTTNPGFLRKITESRSAFCYLCHIEETYKRLNQHKQLNEQGKIVTAIKTSVQRIGVELPLFQGRIICATCHNPHQEGVITIDAAATGTQRENKLRLKPGRRQCTGCHWDKN